VPHIRGEERARTSSQCVRTAKSCDDSAVHREVRRRLVGRRNELSTLLQIFDRTRQQEFQLVLVLGEAGAGKSALIEEFLARLEPAPSVARGSGREGALAAPFTPFGEALRSGHLLPDDPSILDLLVHPAHGAVNASGIEPTRTRLFEAVLELFGDLDGPCVLVLDDVQWADPASLELLVFLVRNARREQLMTVVISRDDIEGAVTDMMEEMRRSGRLVTLPVLPLNMAELGELAVDITGAELDMDTLRTLADITGGNAFFAEHILRSPRADGSLPTAVRLLLRRELDDVGEDARRAGELAAVAGGSLPFEVLEAALADHPEAVHEAVRARILVSDGDLFRLRHSLYRAALLERLPPDRLRKLHAELAAVGERLTGQGRSSLSPIEIARHWQAAGDRRRALPALAVAARLAATALAFEDACGAWSAVIDLLDEPAMPAIVDRSLLSEALVGAAGAARWSGHADRAVALVTRALALTTPDERIQRAQLHRQRAHFRRVSGTMDAAAWDIERAAQLLLPEDPPDLRADILAEQARLTLLLGEIERGHELATEALRLARNAQDATLEGRALSALGVAQFDRGDATSAIMTLREAQQLCATYGSFDDNIRATTNLSFVLFESDRLGPGLAAATEAVELARRAGVLHRGGAAAIALDNVINASLLMGRWPDAERQIDDLLATGQLSPEHRGWLLVTRAQLCAMTGRFEEAEADLGRLDAKAAQDHLVRLGAAAAGAELAVWRHQPVRAMSVASRALDEAGSPTERAYVLRWCLRAQADLADLARLRNDVPARHRAAEAGTELVARYGTDLIEGGVSPFSSALLRAEMARVIGNSDPSLWSAVVAAAAELPVEQSYAEYRYAQAVLVAGDQSDDRAGQSLATARRTADRLGARPLLDAIDALVRQRGVSIELPLADETDAATALGLTRREREVLAQLRLGLTNRKIARALGMTEKTASVHVSNILAKLGVANRTAAAAVAQQLGLP
jgi:DNA-binding NarL/FixJ family response regulator